MDKRFDPIGIFDSGLGGLSVWREISLSLPSESIVYFGDGLNCPYGPKNREEITRLTDEAVGWLVRERHAKLVVLACNTATAAAVTELRFKYNIPIVGMEPAVKPAALSTKTGIVAILATEASLKGEHYRRTSQAYGAGIKLLPTVGEGFVEIVENDMEDTPEAYETVKRVIEPLIAAGADRIVLGCTHYTFLTGIIREVIGDRDVEVVDSAPAVERRVASLLDEYDIAAYEGNFPVYEFHTLAGADYYRRLVAKARAVRKMVF